MKKVIISLLILFTIISLNAQDDPVLEVVGEYSGTLPSIVAYNTSYGDYLYLAGDGKIHIYKLDDPGNPTFIKTVDHSFIRKIYSGGNDMLAVYASNKITLYDISDPENPAKLSDYTAGKDLVKVELTSDYMYIIFLSEYDYNKEGTFEIVDISDPANPNLLDSFQPGTNPGFDFHVTDDFSRAYTAHFNTSSNQTVLTELDISDPSNIRELKSVNLSNMTFKIAKYGDYLFLLQSGKWAPPAYIRAVEIVDGGDWIDYSATQVSSSRPQDMHVKDNSLTLSLWEGGIKDYSFNSSTNTFTEVTTIDFDRSSHMAKFVTTSDTGPGGLNSLNKTNADMWEIYYYYIMNNNSPAHGFDSEFSGDKVFVARKWFMKGSEEVFLSMGINPLEAEANGCSVSPSVGTHPFTKDQEVEVTATDNKDGGWIFEKWTGSASGTSPGLTIKMDTDKTLDAHFKELKLVVTGSKTQTTCACDVSEEEVTMSTLSATAFGDNWIVSGIKLQASENGDDRNHISEINIKHGNNLLWSTSFFGVDNGELTATFNQAVTITEGQTQVFTINYKFNLTEEEINNNQDALTFKVDGNAIAKPQNHDDAPILGSTTGINTIGLVYNTAQNMFMNIKKAIDDATTETGHEVILCPETFKEDLIINKGITLRSRDENDPSAIEQLTNVKRLSGAAAINIDADNITLKDLLIRSSNIGVVAVKQKNLKIDNCRFVGNLTHGVLLNSMEDVTITNNRFVRSSQPVDEALSINSPKNVLIQDNTFIRNYHAIKCHGVADKTFIRFNTFEYNQSGVVISGGSYYSVSDNTFDYVELAAVDISDGEANIISFNTYNNSAKELGKIPFTDVKGNSNIYRKNKIYDAHIGIHSIETKNMKVIDNKIYRSDESIQIQSSSGFLIKSNYLTEGKFGISLNNCENFKIISNKITKFENLTFGFGGYGVYLSLNNKNGRIASNSLLENCSGIKFGDNNSNIKLYFNNFNDNFCTFTGLNIDGDSEVEVIGNNFYNNNGAAIFSNSSEEVNISSNNFAENDVAIINENSSLIADNNYWGGNQPGQSDYQGDVIINNWLSSPVNLQTAFEENERFVTPGESDTLLLVVQNMDDLFDEVEVTFSEDNNWIEGELTQTGTMTDSTGLIFQLPYTIPAEAGADANNRIYASVVSTKTDGLFAADTTVLTTYEATVQSITLSPDSSTIMQGESFSFYYSALDEKEIPIEFTPNWSVDKGTISPEGLLETTGVEGEVTVTVTDPVSGKFANVKCYVASEEEELTDITLIPSEITLEYGDSYQFNATAYNQFNYKMETALLWSASDGDVNQGGLYIANSQATSATITVSDTNGVISAAANITIENVVTDVNEVAEIPSEYVLKQNYPNPFNPTTVIEYHLVEEAKVTLKVFNMLGQLVSTLVDNDQFAGQYQYHWNASNLASGIYFCEIRADGKSSNYRNIIKMILLK